MYILDYAYMDSTINNTNFELPSMITPKNSQLYLFKKK